MDTNKIWTKMRNDQIEAMSEKQILQEILEVLVCIDKKIDYMVSKNTTIPETRRMYRNEMLSSGLDVMTLLSLPEHLRTTVKVLFEKGSATAEDISKITRKERAVESGYLNQLVRMGYVNKYRRGRKVYFSITDDK
jgi:DNA-binding transcriptional ArsR family regulator